MKPNKLYFSDYFIVKMFFCIDPLTILVLKDGSEISNGQTVHFNKKKKVPYLHRFSSQSAASAFGVDRYEEMKVSGF